MCDSCAAQSNQAGYSAGNAQDAIAHGKNALENSKTAAAGKLQEGKEGAYGKAQQGTELLLLMSDACF